MPFKADYACLSKKCMTPEGEAPTYELPTGSTRCPKCGSKRIRQLFNNPNVIARGATPDPDFRLTSSSPFARSTRLLQPAADHADAVKPPTYFNGTHVPIQTFSQRAGDTGGMAGGKGRPMTVAEIRQAAFRDPGSVAGVIGRRMASMMRAGSNGVPTTVTGRPKE